MRPVPDEPSEGQESVWSYPRPPRLEPFAERLRVVLGGQTIADTTRGYRVLETSHPPVYYFPPEDIEEGVLRRVRQQSFCEFKGLAHYYDVHSSKSVVPSAAWGYDDPVGRFAPLKGHVAFYCAPMDACYVGDEQAQPQPGGFYGGWITSKVVGPFKGIPGSMGW